MKKRPKDPKIIKDDKILGGSPVIEGTRISVSAILGQLKVGNGRGREYVREIYPQLTQRDIDAVLEYASKRSY